VPHGQHLRSAACSCESMAAVTRIGPCDLPPLHESEVRGYLFCSLEIPARSDSDRDRLPLSGRFCNTNGLKSPSVAGLRTANPCGPPVSDMIPADDPSRSRCAGYGTNVTSCPSRTTLPPSIKICISARNLVSVRSGSTFFTPSNSSDTVARPSGRSLKRVRIN